MPVITTSIGSKIVVIESMDTIMQSVSEKNICIFTLVQGGNIGIASKHIVYIKK